MLSRDFHELFSSVAGKYAKFSERGKAVDSGIDTSKTLPYCTVHKKKRNDFLNILK